MPDENKLRALETAGYVQRSCCGMCRHSTFASIRPGPWGSCAAIPYQHGKHTETRGASIHVFGFCPLYQEDATLAAGLTRSGFDRFKVDP